VRANCRADAVAPDVDDVRDARQGQREGIGRGLGRRRGVTDGDAHGARELALLEHGRAIEQAVAGSGVEGTTAVAAGMSRAELDERLRRLEQQTRTASAERSFGDGLRTLERRGVGGTQT
jgi:hypothetical protein